MSRQLGLPDSAPRVIAPTTTKKLAQRMLSASVEIAHAMPKGFYAVTPLDILLRLHVAEDDAHYFTLGDLSIPGNPSASTVARWVKALQAQGLIDRQNELLALSQKGYDLVVGMVDSVYKSQRDLD